MSDTPDASSAPRTPPHDLQAEMGVIGSMLLSQDASYLARERLSEESFYKLAHQDIFNAIQTLSDAHSTVDLILLRDELTRQEKLEKVGGVGYLLELMEAVPTSANAEHYIEIVREHAVRRHLIETSSQIQKDSYEASQEVDDLLDRAEQSILSVRHQKETGTTKEIHDVLQDIVARLEQLHQHPGQLTGLASGYYDLDDLTGGFQPGEFIVVAARPSMGKTSFALNVLHNVCVVQRRPAALYSLEMPAEQIVSNFLCIHNRLDTHDFRRGSLSQRQWDRLEASLDELVGLPLYIDDSPTQRVLDLRARARRLHARHKIELIVVDYLQLVTSNRSTENRATEVAEISAGLKALARELKVPLIAVAQLSRRVEQEQRRPRMSDLRESGAIEQDADVIVMLHRSQQPGEEEEEPAAQAAGSEADLIIAKQRNGPTGVVRLVFQRKYLRFESRASQPALD
jgi:replicative DNA helicase